MMDCAPEVYIVDRWLSLEALHTFVIIDNEEIEEIFQREFGDDWEDAVDALREVCPEAFWSTRNMF
jgi:hypothetical protein